MKRERWGTLPIKIYIWMLKTGRNINTVIRIDNPTPPSGKATIIGDGPMVITLNPYVAGMRASIRRYYGFPPGRERLFLLVRRIMYGHSRAAEDSLKLYSIIADIVMDAAMTAVGSYGADTPVYFMRHVSDPIFDELGWLGKLRLRRLFMEIYDKAILHHGKQNPSTPLAA